MSKKLKSRADFDGSGRVNTLYVYERLHECLDSADVAYAVSRLFEDLAYHFHIDTGVKAGDALGRDRKPHATTTEGEV